MTKKTGFKKKKTKTYDWDDWDGRGKDQFPINIEKLFKNSINNSNSGPVAISYLTLMGVSFENHMTIVKNK